MPHRSLLQSFTPSVPVSDENVEIGAGGAFTHSFVMHENDVWFVELRHIRR